MKQLAQYQDGRLELQQVPTPTAPPGGVLVRVTHSVISVGTEKMKVEQAKMNLLQKARARPDQVRQVLQTAKTLGWASALEKVRNRLETPTPLGYSAAGVVEAVDPGNTRFRVGDRVACGGAECSFHAEYVAIPDMLAAHVPDGVENWEAAYTTIVSIALQTVRQLEPALGDRVLVIGQGLLGLLITGILRANGVRVMALDLGAGPRALRDEDGGGALRGTGTPEPGGRDPRLVGRLRGRCRRPRDRDPVQRADGAGDRRTPRPRAHRGGRQHQGRSALEVRLREGAGDPLRPELRAGTV